ncbi:hypothetical protein, partial [Chryseobacterium sp. OSA05B]|uniref:hypothetical protein n=1 Tax=Chryseobacterium sp. OSA05B TaxID=2862650 RepID=UPI001CC059F2
LSASGLVSRVQTYCGLEIAAMQISPRTNCRHRALAAIVMGIFNVVIRRLPYFLSTPAKDF